MVSLAQETAKQCLHPDALEAMNVARAHLADLNFVSGRLAANGEDVMAELADAVTAYKEHEFKQFGSDIGTVLRKVFLSKRTGKGLPTLPEGMPDPEVVSNVTRGLLEGFFGEGSEVDVLMGGDAMHAAQTLPIDLHSCINNNMAFFQSVYAEIMFFFAQKSVAG